jgi:hypothetical protein
MIGTGCYSERVVWRSLRTNYGTKLLILLLGVCLLGLAMTSVPPLSDLVEGPIVASLVLSALLPFRMKVVRTADSILVVNLFRSYELDATCVVGGEFKLRWWGGYEPTLRILLSDGSTRQVSAVCWSIGPADLDDLFLGRVTFELT